ncbi:MAG TPA: DUF4040 domain-containing protein [Mycobacteriales bacterium]|nr:DUF4040 domain-containing protein [Mycobacteriales bacterium]
MTAGPATTAVVAIALTLVLLGAIAVVRSEDPQRQAVTLSVFGICLTVLFFVLDAPDVALSQVAVGTVIVPLMVLLAISKIRGGR